MIEIRIGFKKLPCMLIVIGILIGNNSFFIWDTYNNSFIRIIAKIIAYSSYMLLFGMAIKASSLKLKDKRIILPIYCAILFLHMDFGGAQYRHASLSGISMIFAIYSLTQLSEEVRKRILVILIVATEIVILPSLVYFLLRNAEIDIAAYDILESASEGKRYAGIYYYHYPMGLIINDRTFITRFCGIFDEPGVVGTITAFLTILSFKISMSKILKALLIVEGILSMSVAYYLIVLIFIVVESFVNGAMKFALSLSIIMLFTWIFFNFDFQNEFIYSLQNRVDLTSPFLIRNNRTNINFDVAFDSFINAGGYPLWMGYGRAAYTYNSLMSGASSYKCIIYDHGIIGFILYFSFFIIASFVYNLDKRKLPFLLAFIASMYQRPYIYNFLYMTIFILGISSEGEVVIKKYSRRKVYASN